MPAITISDWLKTASSQLKLAGISSYNLDAELILSNLYQKDRTYLHANSEQIISTDICETANNWLKDRINRIPLAYIAGYKEFFGHTFTVNRHVLIPRPESEDIINLLLEFRQKYQTKVIDVGTGSGCLGISVKLELPDTQVLLTDISADALGVARQNAQDLGASVEFCQSNLFSEINATFDVIISNLPYVDKSWELCAETNFEPAVALFADNNGLDLIYKLIDEATKKLNDNGLLILESDLTQQAEITNYAHENSFKLEKMQGFVMVFSKKLYRDTSNAIKTNQ